MKQEKDVEFVEIGDQDLQNLFLQDVVREEDKLSKYSKSDWKKLSKALVPYWLDKYIDQIDISVACAENPNLTEEFIRKYVNRVDFHALSENAPIMKKLSNYFKRKFRGKLLFTQSTGLGNEIDYSHVEEELRMLGAFDDDEQRDMEVIEYTDDYAYEVELETEIHQTCYPEPLDEEMDGIVCKYTKEDWNNVSAVWKLHWLERYDFKVNWSIVCEENKYLTDDFLTKYYSSIDFEALSLNEFAKLSLSFIENNLDKFNLNHPIPCLIRVLTYDFAVKHKEKISMDEKTFAEFFTGTVEEQDQIGKLFFKDYIEAF